MNFRLALLSAVVVSAALSQGCASIVSDTLYPVTVNSSPDGAKFKVVNQKTGAVMHAGTTPATVTLDAHSGFFGSGKYEVRVEKEGYDSQITTLNASLDGWYWGNIVFGGLIGMLIVDPATGAMWKLPPMISTSLAEKSPSTSMTAPDGSTVAVMSLNDVPADLRSSMIPVEKF